MEKRIHFPTLSMALAMAMTRCWAWRFTRTGEAFSALQLIDFVTKYDAAHQLESPSFYMVSIEGAIGVSPGQEYLTQWLFVPMEAGPERDALLKKTDADLAAVRKQSAV